MSVADVPTFAVAPSPRIVSVSLVPLADAVKSAPRPSDGPSTGAGVHVAGLRSPAAPCDAGHLISTCCVDFSGTSITSLLPSSVTAVIASALAPAFAVAPVPRTVSVSFVPLVDAVNASTPRSAGKDAGVFDSSVHVAAGRCPAPPVVPPVVPPPPAPVVASGSFERSVKEPVLVSVGLNHFEPMRLPMMSLIVSWLVGVRPFSPGTGSTSSTLIARDSFSSSMSMWKPALATNDDVLLPAATPAAMRISR